MISIAKYWVRPISLALILVMSLSLLWCVDAGCSSDENGDECASLLCTLLHEQDDHSSGSSTQCCTCVAQASFLTSMPTPLNLIVDCENVAIHVEAYPLSSPSRSVFRPPII